jgi:hypothetical protein
VCALAAAKRINWGSFEEGKACILLGTQNDAGVCSDELSRVF